MDAHVREIVTESIAPETTTGHSGGVAAAVYVAGHIQFFNFGFADEAERRPVTSDTLFNVASVRKLFEATLVALGVLRSELKLDDPVNKYVAELHGDYISRITIGQLATQHPVSCCRPIIRRGQTPRTPWPNSSTC
ncbi:serine hydrolase [Bradyrhizobium sp. SRL28]|uniref:serine hydrolase n=1 Tax=Bradyrhizobium sp. SRL28 TaxID=2836178 RepID=UPI0024BFA779|nr:serine hydrolase [Bradyrhizobium sp. SRL28]